MVKGRCCPCPFWGGEALGGCVGYTRFCFCDICGYEDVDVGVVAWLRWHWGMCIYMKIIVVLQRLIVQFPPPLQLIRTLLKSMSLSSCAHVHIQRTIIVL